MDVLIAASTPGMVIEPGKMFVGALSFDTTTKSLYQYFSKFGELVDCEAIMAPGENRCRGFGFINYMDPGSVNKVLESGRSFRYTQKPKA